jgi:hypothetical protein
MNPSNLTLRIVPTDALVIGAAYAILAIAIYLLASRHRSKAAFISSALFAYCSITLIAKFVLFFTLFSDPNHGYKEITDTFWFYMALNGFRPYALFIGALFTLYFVKSRLAKRVGL